MWFKRREEKRTELPELPELAIRKERLPALPSFRQEIEGEEMIKSELTPRETRIYSQELEPSEQKEERKEFKLPMPRKMMLEAFPKKVEPVFVRLDKFQNAIKNLNEIRKQLSEIESHLVDINNIRERETKDLEKEEEEITEIKAKLESIDAGIFSKLD